MKILPVLFALIAGVAFASIQVRHAGSISKAIFGMNHKWLFHKVDNVDRLLIVVAGTSFVALLLTIVLTSQG